MSAHGHDSHFGRSSDPNRYLDILYHPRPVSDVHPQMNLQNRAAQFAPFAALTGYEDVLEETARDAEKAAEKTIRFSPPDI